MPAKHNIQDIFVSGRPQTSEYQVLTPRTPHSRSGRAEEALTELELEEIQNDDAHEYLSYRQQQSKPLLASSSGSSLPASGYRSTGDDEDKLTKLQLLKKYIGGLHTIRSIPLLLGSAVAVILLVFIVLSIKRPDALEHVVGQSATVPEVEDLAVAPPSPSFVDTIPAPGRLISYENYTKFPLTGGQYLQECNRMMGGFMHHAGGYWTTPAMGAMDVLHHDDVTNYHLPEGERTAVCSKSITYQLDGQIGLVADLALMAQVAAFARERNRTFFVDDTYWNRGKWTDHFQDVRARQPGPERGCRAPPPEELVACPRVARHWVVNSRTAKYHLGHSFSEEYEDPYAHQVNRQKPIFGRALQSFTQTIRPNAHNAELIRSARVELASVLSLPPHPPNTRNDDTHPNDPTDAEAILTQHNPDPYIAVHLRRGDRKAANFPYRGSYVPTDHYVSAARDTWSRLYTETSDPSSLDPNHFPSPPITYVASDSPSTIKDFMNAFTTSTAVFSLGSSTDPALRALAPQREYVQAEFNNEKEEERVTLTRGMIVDFAMLSGLWAWEDDVVPGATVCTLSSSICKLAAVGLGWDRAFGFGDGGDYSNGEINDKRKRWIEIDNKGSVDPEWKAFDIFT